MRNIQVEDEVRNIRAVAYAMDAMAGNKELTEETAECLLLLKRNLLSSAENIEKES